MKVKFTLSTKYDEKKISTEQQTVLLKKQFVETNSRAVHLSGPYCKIRSD